MPEPETLRLRRADGKVLVTQGPRVLFHFDEADSGMRNLAMVALAEAGVAGNEVASLFGLSPDHFSKLRVRARRLGSAELVRPMGRPPKLTGADLAKARRWSAEGTTGTDIARRLGVSDATVSRALAGTGVALELVGEPVVEDEVGDEPGGGGDEPGGGGDEPGGGGDTRLGHVEASCRYAGAMLLHPFLDLVGAGDVLGRLGSGPARRYDTTSVALCAMFGLALGSGSVEAIKHLGRADLGALAGIAAAPEMATLRTRLAAMAEGCDPLGLMAPVVFVHPFRSNPYSDSGVFVHPPGQEAHVAPP